MTLILRKVRAKSQKSGKPQNQQILNSFHSKEKQKMMNNSKLRVPKEIP